MMYVVLVALTVLRTRQPSLRRVGALPLVILGGFFLVCEAPWVFASEEARAATQQTAMLETGALAPADTVEVPRLSPEKAAAYLDATPEAVVVDVRTPEEVAASGRLESALMIDFRAEDFAERAMEALDPEMPVVLYCRSGNRAGRAADLLVSLGFTRLVNAGGFEALRAAGLPTEPHDP
ncbi:MAG: rhodanese-like domain-containing protein [Bacteroidota bacterium]